MKILFSAPSTADFIRLLRAWRLWLLAALIGMLAAAALYYISPPEYRARATVVVTFNMEESWPNKPDNELFYYLERESRKVQELAWADATLQMVAAQTGLTISELRSGKLELSHPQDGGWHFYANDPGASQAQKLASSWAEAFTTQVQQGIQTAVALDAARKALATKPDDAQAIALVNKLETEAMAITPEMQVSLAQSTGLPVARKSNLATYLLAGTGIAVALAALLVLFFVRAVPTTPAED
jgi:capsular polysaccharide biosynthesis protein